MTAIFRKFTTADFRRELKKLMPGYKWTIHRGTQMVATGFTFSGSNRLSTLCVERRERNNAAEYEVKSAGYGLRAPWLETVTDGTLARALRGLQDHYEWQANKYRAHADALQHGRQAPKGETK